MKDIMYRLLLLTEYNFSSDIKPTMSGPFATTAGAVITIAQVILYGAAVIILMITGIKFITAAPDGKAQIKEKMIPTVIGAILLFAVGSIIRIVGGFAVDNV